MLDRAHYQHLMKTYGYSLRFYYVYYVAAISQDFFFFFVIDAILWGVWVGGRLYTKLGLRRLMCIKLVSAFCNWSDVTALFSRMQINAFAFGLTTASRSKKLQRHCRLTDVPSRNPLSVFFLLTDGWGIQEFAV